VWVFVHGGSSAHCLQSRGRDKTHSQSFGAEQGESRAAAACTPPAPGTGSTAVLVKQAGEGGDPSYQTFPARKG